MNRSSEHIVTTHTGSLPRPPQLAAVDGVRGRRPQRIGRYAELVGRENVMAGTDCGFATFAAAIQVHPTIAWEKLRAMAEGARIASQRLWSRAAV
jgi:methionine synthase II (cobalamin-independent)